MDRQNLPARADAPDMPERIGEVRLPGRAGGHEARAAREAGT